MKTTKKLVTLMLACIIMVIACTGALANGETFKYDGIITWGSVLTDPSGVTDYTAIMKFKSSDGSVYGGLCMDKDIEVDADAIYRLMSNLEIESVYDTNAQLMLNKVRKMINLSYPVIDINTFAANAGAASQISEADAIAGLQAAIWSVTNPGYSLPGDSYFAVKKAYDYLIANVGNGMSSQDLQNAANAIKISVDESAKKVVINDNEALVGPYILKANSYFAKDKLYDISFGGVSNISAVNAQDAAISKITEGTPFYIKITDAANFKGATVSIQGKIFCGSEIAIIGGEDDFGKTQPVMIIPSTQTVALNLAVERELITSFYVEPVIKDKIYVPAGGDSATGVGPRNLGKDNGNWFMSSMIPAVKGTYYIDIQAGNPWEKNTTFEKAKIIGKLKVVVDDTLNVTCTYEFEESVKGLYDKIEISDAHLSIDAPKGTNNSNYTFANKTGDKKTINPAGLVPARTDNAKGKLEFGKAYSVKSQYGYFSIFAHFGVNYFTEK